MQFNEIKLARATITIVFLALIRCILEFFRLEYTLGTQLTIDDVRLYIIGALIAAVSCMLMTVLLFYSKNRLIILTGAATVVILIVLKFSSIV